MKRLLSALAVFLVLPLCAQARDAFTDLPGVKDPAAQNEVELGIDCTSRIVQPWRTGFPRRDGLSRRVYSCNDGGNVSIRSNRAPDLIEYRKFRQRYQ